MTHYWQIEVADPAMYVGELALSMRGWVKRVIHYWQIEVADPAMYVDELALSRCACARLETQN